MDSFGSQVFAQTWLESHGFKNISFIKSNMEDLTADHDGRKYKTMQPMAGKPFDLSAPSEWWFEEVG